MYNQKMVACLKANGKVLRENKDTVLMPFGQEYSILLKNLNSVRAQVRVSVDGTDATEGVVLVIQPNSELELSRFIKNGNMESGNAFKFIERTGSIENHRGIKVDDGLIRIEFQFEKPYVPQIWNQSITWDTYYNHQPSITCSTSSSSALRGMVQTNNVSYSANATAKSVESLSAEAQSEVNDIGITVPGSKVDQRFTQASWFQVEPEKHVMIMHLLGQTETGKTVTKPITVKSKPKCTSCGKLNKANAKFCSECGTGLEIV